MPRRCQRQMDGGADDIHAIHSRLPVSYSAAVGGVVGWGGGGEGVGGGRSFSDGAVAISTNSDTKCKVPPPSKSPPIIKGP